jgi:hypothetical protein
MLSLWSLMHGTAMLMIRGRVAGTLRTQMFHACLDAVEVIIADAARTKGKPRSGPKWPPRLILGEAAESTVNYDEKNDSPKRIPAKRGSSSRRKSTAGVRAVRAAE